jgi:phenylacetic acid degradation operon negative regulatory protein
MTREPPSAPAGISLLMILGVHLLHGPEATWQETLVGALERLGYTRHAARRAIARAVQRGVLAAERDGRRARMSLTSTGRELLSDGERRLFSFGEPWTWDGSWLLLSLRVPESQRAVRQRLRKQLAWAGFGSLGHGLWLTPHIDREQEIARIVAGEPAAAAWTFRARHAELGDLELIEGYESFIRKFGGLRATRPEDCFVTLTSMLVDWRLFPFIDPDLPPNLLPNGRLRERAHRLFNDRRDRWIEPARRFLASSQL